MLKKILVVVCLLLNTSIVFSENKVSSWYLPQKIDTNNTKLDFELDTTWHMLNGKVLDFSGDVMLENAEDPSSVKISLKVPVGKMDTDNGMRDDKMRTVMSADKFPDISFEAYGLQNKCTPAMVLKDGMCSDVIKGQLTIKDIKKDIELPVKITKVNEDFKVAGQYSLNWSEYGVEDPSILIAKVDPDVLIKYSIILKAN
jgi:polyisoprenoid-binding protein YceI